MNSVNSEVEKESSYTNSLKVNRVIDSTLLSSTKVNKDLIAELSYFQKILLITNGTVTELLEHYLEEPVKLEKLYEKVELDISHIPLGHQSLIDDNDSHILVRKVLLKGMSTIDNYLYAESSILINRLPQKFRDDLIYSHLPIGKLWSKYRFETYKTDFVVQREKASKDIALHLNIDVGSDILSRTYCIYSQGKKTMIITEKFSAKCFVD